MREPECLEELQEPGLLWVLSKQVVNGREILAGDNEYTHGLCLMPGFTTEESAADFLGRQDFRDEFELDSYPVLPLLRLCLEKGYGLILDFGWDDETYYDLSGDEE